MKQEIKHHFDIPASHFWQAFIFDNEFECAFYRHMRLTIEHASLREYDSGADRHIVRRRHLIPQRNLPPALTRLIGSASRVKEKSVFWPQRCRVDVDITLPVIHRMVELKGAYTWNEHSAASFTRTWQATCTVSIPFLGPGIERFLLDELESSLEEGATFCRNWFARPTRAAVEGNGP